jgi:hypothetical protein
MWTLAEFIESFRYGKLYTPYKIKHPYHLCYRVRRDKNKVFIDKSEKVHLLLPLYNNADYANKIAEIGDLIFLHADHSSSLLRTDPTTPFFAQKKSIDLKSI